MWKGKDGIKREEEQEQEQEHEEVIPMVKAKVLIQLKRRLLPVLGQPKRADIYAPGVAAVYGRPLPGLAPVWGCVSYNPNPHSNTCHQEKFSGLPRLHIYHIY